jgi:hypothetical protein
LLPLADRVVELTPRRRPVHTKPVRVELAAGGPVRAGRRR